MTSVFTAMDKSVHGDSLYLFHYRAILRLLFLFKNRLTATNHSINATYQRTMFIVKSKTACINAGCFTRLEVLSSDYSKNLTVTPDLTFLPKSLASQLVKRIQPCDAVLEMAEGFGVP